LHLDLCLSIIMELYERTHITLIVALIRGLC
jgi:hypothetical protein